MAGEIATAASVRILGGRGLLLDLVVAGASDAGCTIVLPPEMPGFSESDVVVILVDPAVEDWYSARRFRAPIVVVSRNPVDELEAVRLVLQGADAILDLNSAPQELSAAITSAANGVPFLRPEHLLGVVGLLRVVAQLRLLPRLSRRELEILELIECGKSVKETARELGVAAKTVENVQSRLFKKLNVRNRAQAVSRMRAVRALLDAPVADSSVVH